MKSSDVFPSKYLKAADLDEDVELTIRSVVLEELKSEDGSEQKPICYFEEGERGLLLNKTNWNALAQQFGDESDAWAGKTVTTSSPGFFKLKVSLASLSRYSSLATSETCACNCAFFASKSLSSVCNLINWEFNSALLEFICKLDTTRYPTTVKSKMLKNTERKMVCFDVFLIFLLFAIIEE